MSSRFELSLLLLFSYGVTLFAQTDNIKHTVSGYIYEDISGEQIAGATVYESNTSNYTISNNYGYYSIEIGIGSHEIIFTHIGYSPDTIMVDVHSDVRRDIRLSEMPIELSGAVVSNESKTEYLSRPMMGVNQISGSLLKKHTQFVGEPDLIKLIQLMPGVQTPSEASIGFGVRGGGLDQNLILMDEAPVYNAGHLMGFFSVFNTDAIRNATLYKGDFSAKYGGRLSSVLDVHLKEGSADRFKGYVSIGLIASKVLVEGPIGEKVTYMFGARRTYLDMFFPFYKELDGTALFFHDINGKISWNINENNRIYLSATTSKDKIEGDVGTGQTAGIQYYNTTTTFRWNHIFTPNLFANISAIYSNYNYEMDADQGTSLNYKWTSILGSFGLKMENNLYVNPSNSVEFGIHSTLYKLSSGNITPLSETSSIQEYSYPLKNALESALYLQNTQKLTDRFTLRYGIRTCLFNALNDNGMTYLSIDPRASASFMLSESMSAKLSYNRVSQFIHQAVYSVSGSPFDVWLFSSSTVKPQFSDQFSFGIFNYFHDEQLKMNVELFYKNNKNTIDFKDHPTVLANEYVENELRFGKSFSYGLESMLEFNFKKISGWVSYTYTKAKNIIPDINGGNPYDNPQVHNHIININASYNFTSRLSATAVWTYNSGCPTSFPVGRYEIGGVQVPLYEGRNCQRLPDYHRLDLSVNLKGKNYEKKRIYGEWDFSIYNVYCRKNAWSIFFVHDEETGAMKAKMYYLFPIIPSVSYKLNF